MNKLIALLGMILAFNAFTCDDLDLYNRTIKTDIYYQYAPFGKMEVVKNFPIFSSDKPYSLTINFKEKPYKISMLFDIKTSTINEKKIVDLKYKFENTEDGRTYESKKLVKLNKDKTKVGIYDWVHGRRMLFVMKDYTIEEWAAMACPKLPSEDDSNE